MSALTPRGVMARTVPRAVTMPVNIQAAIALRSGVESGGVESSGGVEI
jgi:hypothetical protein